MLDARVFEAARLELVVNFIRREDAALTAPDQTVIVVAQRQDQASELLRKSKTAYYRAKPPVGVVREGATHFELANGSRILALPGEERAMHGPTANLLVIDEAARVPDEVFNAASPQLSASKGRLVALSTAFAKSGWFYREWTEGQGYRRWSITAKECPRHTREFLAGERRSMGERWFAMAYLNQFGDDLGAVFSSEQIRRAVTPHVGALFPELAVADPGPVPEMAELLGETVAQAPPIAAGGVGAAAPPPRPAARPLPPLAHHLRELLHFRQCLHTLEPAPR